MSSTLPLPSLPRPPRILHIGNIANNGYQNARILNAAGVPSDVLCGVAAFGAYHIMSTPEWEDADLVGLPSGFDEDYPPWHRIRTPRYRRPEWFAQGPLPLMLPYLVARMDGRASAVRGYGIALEAFRRFLARRFLREGSQRLRNSVLAALALLRAPHSDPAGPPAHPPAGPAGNDGAPPFADLEPFLATTERLRPLMSRYDIVVGYATDCIFPLLAGHPRTFAYEHGTIRAIPFEPTPLGRMTAWAYRKAECALITNCDNIRAAERLALPRFRYIPHPMNDQAIDQADGSEIRRTLETERKTDFVVVHPSRLHWDPQIRHPSWEKGNDVFLRGFARFVREVAPRALLVLVRWGLRVAETEALITELGLVDRVLWVRPMPNRQMLRWFRASDAVADQFWLGTFGGITPKALGCGRPTLIRFDADVHRWCFPELPPVLDSRTPDDVAAHLRMLYRDRDAAADLGRRSAAWYRRYHSEAAIRDRWLEILRESAPSQGPRAGPGVAN